MKCICSPFIVVFEFAHCLFGVHIGTLKFVCGDCNITALVLFLARGRSCGN